MDKNFIKNTVKAATELPQYIPQVRQAERLFDNSFQQHETVPRELANQGKLIIKSFGLSALKPKFYVITDTEKLAIENAARQEGNRNKSHSAFGLPVFDVLSFGAKQYETLDKEKITVKEFALGLALLEVTQQKQIIATAIQGRNGSVKEYIADGDFQITIRGILSSNAQDVFPEDDLNSLIEFCNIPESITVGSDYLARFGITDIVITNYHFTQDEGMRNVQRFTIECLSDTPFEINKKKN